MLEKSKISELNQSKVNLTELIKKKDYKGLKQHLADGMQDYLNSDTFVRYLDFISSFHKYSSRNVRFILGQQPNATHVASFNAWKKNERYVKKGEKAIYVYAPSIRDKLDKDGNKVVDKNGEIQKETRYFLVPVFDVSQTKGEKPLPKMVESIEENLTDPKSFATIYKALIELTDVPISIEAYPGDSHGYYDLINKKIVIKEGLGEVMTVKVLLHEITHSLLHADSSAHFGDKTYSRQEFEAESVAYIVSKHLGFDTSSYSFGYLSSWTNKGNDLESLSDSLEKISNEARKLIDKVDITLNKAYGIGLPQNKFEERVRDARINMGKEKREPKKVVEKKGEVGKLTKEASRNKRFETTTH